MSAPFLMNLLSKAVAYGDTLPNSNPMRRAFDWARSYQGIVVTNPKTYSVSLPQGASQLVFSGVRSTTLDGTSAFTITLNSQIPSTYRVSFISGTNPTLRTNRNLAFFTGSKTVTVAVLANQSVTLTLSAGGMWSGVLVGDTVYIPGPVTNDGSSPFNTLNQGFWQVLSNPAASAVITVARAAGSVFGAAAEGPITLTADTQVQAFSAAGVQVGDVANISAGFSAGNFGAYQVSAVTTNWFEITSTLPLALDVAAEPGAAGLVFYTANKSFIRIETDQNVVAQLNGSSSTTIPTISPIVPGDPENVGWLELMGPVWSLTLLNTSLNTANCIVFATEQG